jgi:hypothetical protein
VSKKDETPMKTILTRVGTCVGLGLALSMLPACGGLAFFSSGAPIGLVTSASTSKEIGTGTVGAKKGEACAMSILYIVTLGDAAATTAAKNGGIAQIGTVDNDDFNLLGIYQRHCTEVTGQ